MRGQIHESYAVPKPCGTNRAEIIAFADDARKRARVEFGYAMVRKFAEACGGTLDPRMSAEVGLDVHALHYFTVFADGLDRSLEIFNQAQMIGHSLLHYPAVHAKNPFQGMQVVLDRDHPLHDANAHQEARWFAFGLLMPENRFREAWAVAQIDSCVAAFGTHRIHIKTRARQLGLLERDIASAAP